MDAASETTVGGKEMSMEETAVLLSIQPEWCSRIFSGYKTVEIRKTRPVSLKEPFKCYIYCTKGTKFFCWKAVDHLYFDDGSHNLFDRRADGMVVGEFICDDIRRIGPEYCAVKEDIESAISGSLLTVPQVKDYAGWKSGMSYGNYHTNTEYIDTPEIPFCITYNNGRFWPPIAWSKFEPLKQGGD